MLHGISIDMQVGFGEPWSPLRATLWSRSIFNQLMALSPAKLSSPIIHVGQSHVIYGVCFLKSLGKGSTVVCSGLWGKKIVAWCFWEILGDQLPGVTL